MHFCVSLGTLPVTCWSRAPSLCGELRVEPANTERLPKGLTGAPPSEVSPPRQIPGVLLWWALTLLTPHYSSSTLWPSKQPSSKEVSLRLHLSAWRLSSPHTSAFRFPPPPNLTSSHLSLPASQDRSRQESLLPSSETCHSLTSAARSDKGCHKPCGPSPLCP